EGYKPEDAVSLRLHEALREIKDRGRGIPVDGHKYTQEELQKALRSVVKAAVENGHGEHLA
ncbi:9035_t:CDS:2, partial [Racocetra persica]